MKIPTPTIRARAARVRERFIVSRWRVRQVVRLGDDVGWSTDAGR
jgi:hypothetical protein